MTKGTVTIDIVARNGQFAAAMGQVHKLVDAARVRMEALGAFAQRALLGVGAAAAFAIKEAADAGRSLALVEGALQANGENVGAWTEQLQASAQSLQRATKFSDDFAMSMYATALGMGVSANRVAGLTQDALALSSATGGLMSVQQAMKALINSSEAESDMLLKRFIPAMRTAKTETERYTIIQQAVQRGTVMMSRETGSLSGELAGLWNVATDIAEEFGNALTPTVREYAASLRELSRDVIAYVKRNQDFIAGFAKLAVGGLAALVVLPKIASALTTIAGVAKWVYPAVSALNVSLGTLSSLFAFTTLAKGAKSVEYIGTVLKNYVAPPIITVTGEIVEMGAATTRAASAARALPSSLQLTTSAITKMGESALATRGAMASLAIVQVGATGAGAIAGASAAAATGTTILGRFGAALSAAGGWLLWLGSAALRLLNPLALVGVALAGLGVQIAKDWASGEKIVATEAAIADSFEATAKAARNAQRAHAQLDENRAPTSKRVDILKREREQLLNAANARKETMEDIARQQSQLPEDTLLSDFSGARSSMTQNVAALARQQKAAYARIAAIDAELPGVEAIANAEAARTEAEDKRLATYRELLDAAKQDVELAGKSAAEQEYIKAIKKGLLPEEAERLAMLAQEKADNEELKNQKERIADLDRQALDQIARLNDEAAEKKGGSKAGGELRQFADLGKTKEGLARLRELATAMISLQKATGASEQQKLNEELQKQARTEEQITAEKIAQYDAALKSGGISREQHRNLMEQLRAEQAQKRLAAWGENVTAVYDRLAKGSLAASTKLNVDDKALKAAEAAIESNKIQTKTNEAIQSIKDTMDRIERGLPLVGAYA